MHLVCRQCAARLTTELQPVPLASQNEAMGEELLPPGQLVQEDGFPVPTRLVIS